MSPIRKLRNSSAAILLATAGMAGFTTLAAAPAAHAAVDPASCSWGVDMSVPRISATCYDNPNPHGWYLRESCEMHTGRIIYVNGTVSYTVGYGTSNAVCPAWTELGESQLIDL